MIWKIRNRTIEFDQTLLMGILNLTPDSFSDGGQYLQPDKAIEHAQQMIAQGAGMIDLGAESTRPGSKQITAREEKERLLPILDQLIAQTEVPISIDTTKVEVAKACLDLGAHVINDVSGLKDSGEEMASLVAHTGAGLVLMHRRGNSETMQAMADYQDVVSDVMAELFESVEIALRYGVKREQIVIDPGLGFAKTSEQNFQLVHELEKFQTLGFPVLLGPSRKSFIGNVTGKDVTDREFGTAAMSAIAIYKGTQILRIHDVGSACDVARVAEATRDEAVFETN